MYHFVGPMSPTYGRGAPPQSHAAPQETDDPAPVESVRRQRLRAKSEPQRARSWALAARGADRGSTVATRARMDKKPDVKTG